MIVKQLWKKYEGYSFELYGRPLDQKTIPYTFLPRDKELGECEVVEYEVQEKEHDEYHFSIEGKYKSTEHMKGYVRAYIK